MRRGKENMLHLILFNADMVRAICGGQKTQTRRAVRKTQLKCLKYPFRRQHRDFSDEEFLSKYCLPPYVKEDVLYVREAWGTWSPTFGTVPKIFYRAEGDAPEGIKWRPSIHMPRDAARIYLRVTEVHAERLQNISLSDVHAEGVNEEDVSALFCVNVEDTTVPFKAFFADLWDKTVKPSERSIYGWEANPLVWVITFERTERPYEV